MEPVSVSELLAAVVERGDSTEHGDDVVDGCALVSFLAILASLRLLSRQCAVSQF